MKIKVKLTDSDFISSYKRIDEKTTVQHVKHFIGKSLIMLDVFINYQLSHRFKKKNDA